MARRSRTGIVQDQCPKTQPYGEPIEVDNVVLDKCINLYLSTGNMSAVGRAVGRTAGWAGKLFKHPVAIERMKQLAVRQKTNSKIASIEECMERLTSIVRGEQFKELEDRVKKAVEGSDNALVVTAIDNLTRYTPQIENNQIKATTMLLTAQGALDPNRGAAEDTNEVIEQIALELMRSEGSVDAILSRIKKEKKHKVIDVVAEPA